MESQDIQKPVLPTKSREVEGVSTTGDLLIGLKRDPESVDDFEHLEAESSPVSDQSIKQLKDDVGDIIDRLNETHEKADSVMNGASHKTDKESSQAEMDLISIGGDHKDKSSSDDIISSSDLGTTTVHSTESFADTFGKGEGEILSLHTQVSEMGDLPVPKGSSDADSDNKSTLDKEFDSYIASKSETKLSHEDLYMPDSTSDSKDLKEIIDIGTRKDDKPASDHEALPEELIKFDISAKLPQADENAEDLLNNLRESVLQEIQNESKELPLLTKDEDEDEIIAEVTKPEPSVFESKEAASEEESESLQEMQEEITKFVEKVVTKAELETDVQKTEPEIKHSTPSPINFDGKTATERILNTVNPGAWFDPDRLDPKVVELVYWRDPKKSGAVFGGVLVILLSLSYFSLISVVAYLSLLLLAVTVSFRIYKNVLQAVQKTQDGHPFKEYLDVDLTLSEEQVQEMASVFVTHSNAGLSELRRLFLVEDLVDSIKFGVLLWCLTYLGAWFNGMTLIIIGFVGLFTLPKVYENNKEQIDQHLEVVRTKISEVMTKVKAAVPIGKKEKDKEQ